MQVKLLLRLYLAWTLQLEVRVQVERHARPREELSPRARFSDREHGGRASLLGLEAVGEVCAVTREA